MNNAEVAHIWANQSRTSGKGSNFYFQGPNLYSYGRHFMVGRILSTGVAVITTSGYSNSTARHISYARRAVSHRTVVYCNDPADSVLRNMRSARDAIADKLAEMQRPRIRQTTRGALALQAEQLALQANAYREAMIAVGEGDGSEAIAVHNLQGMADQIAAAKVAEAELQAARQRAREADDLATLAKWRTGEVLAGTRLYSLPPALRLGYTDSSKFGPGVQTIETSHGARIPVADALRLWPLVLRVMKGDKDYTPGMPLGDYRLTQIRTDGSIRVGCHDIAFSELQAIALQLGV
jgi:hypothetical protein